jgi:nickel transport protein
VRPLRLATIAALLFLAIPAGGHDLQHEVEAGEAIRLSFFFGDGTPFSYEAYEVYREGEEIAFQTGRTDALGRVALLPDRSGKWRIRVYSEDGHGADFVFPVNEGGRAGSTKRSISGRYGRLLTGIAVIFGVFGLMSLLRRRRT